MELDHEFTIPVPIDQAWNALLDLERVAPCVPGAALDTVDGEEFTGRMRVKVGAMTITYKGAGTLTVTDAAAHTVTLEGSAKEARGAGTASATVQATLHDDGASTRVVVHTKLNVTGRPAQFGRNLLSEVGAKLISKFADNLADELTNPSVPAAVADDAEAVTGPVAAPADSGAASDDAASDDAVAGAPAVKPAPAPADEAIAKAARDAVERAKRRDDDAIDLLEVAGPSVAKRVVPVIGGLVAVFAVWQVFRKRRGRHAR